VEQRYRQLAMAGKVSERRAYELLGELMALDGAPDKQEEPSGRIPK
jgi:hypothetical protein